MCERTLFNCKNKLGGMTVAQAKRLKVLDEKNSTLKKLQDEQMLDASLPLRPHDRVTS